jgi:kinetochore protein Mis13/DSN1
MSANPSPGLPAHPHPSVPAASFHKHIDGDQPDAARLAQLLIWCTARAASTKPDPPDKNDKNKDKGPAPSLSAKGMSIVQEVQKGIIQALADRRIDTAPYARQAKPATPRKAESTRDINNRVFEAQIQSKIDRLV